MTTPSVPRPYLGHYDALIMSNPEARAVYLTGVEDGFTRGYERGRTDLISAQLEAQQRTADALNLRAAVKGTVADLDAARARRKDVA